MKNLIVFSLIMFSTVACKAQSTYYGSDSYYDGYVSNPYPDDLTDWHLEARIRISNGISSGLITNRESNRLYDELERIERKEYFYQEDGNFSAWEQDEIWEDVINFNRNFGFQLTDLDRVRFGYDVRGFNRIGYGPWFYTGGFNFYRFDNWGFGNRRYGYLIPRNACSYRYDHRGRSNHYSNYYYSNRNYVNRNHNNGNYRNNDNRNNNRNNDFRNNGPRGTDRSSNTYNRSEGIGSRPIEDNRNRTSSSRRFENSNSSTGSATRGNSREFDNRTSSERGSMSGTRPSTRANSNNESRRSESASPSRNSRTESRSSERLSDSSPRSTRRN